MSAKPNRVVPKGDDRESAVLFASETITASSAKDVYPAGLSPFEQEIHQRADTITAVLSKIMDQPDSLRRWGLNE